MTPQGPFYVYAIHRPSGVPCYVGKGKGDRWKDHGRGSHNRHLANIYRQAGGELPVSMVWAGLSEADACALEIETIGLIGREIHGGTLVNQTDGGDGVSGLRHSEETRKLIGAVGKGRRHTPETKAKMSATRTGVKRSPEFCAKLGASRKGKAVSLDVREKISASLKGRGPSPEHMGRLRLINAGAKRSPEARANMRAAQRGRARASDQREMGT